MMNRIEKYRKKLDPEIIGQRYDATKDLAVQSQEKYFASAEELELKVKSIVSAEPSILHHFYIAFAEEICKKQREFKGQTLLNELRILDDKWERRGLNPILLEKIKNFYVPVYVPVIITYFKLDESLLDGPDVLA